MYDYAAGKADWIAAGLPTEGRRADARRIASIADRDVITCSLDTRAEDVRARLNGRDVAVVVRDTVVLGVVRSRDLDGRADAAVGELMQEAPPTLRADVAIEELDERLRDIDADSALVTTPQGQLIGVVRRVQT